VSKRTVTLTPLARSQLGLDTGVRIVTYRCDVKGCGEKSASIWRTGTGELWWVTTGPAVTGWKRGVSEPLAQRESEIASSLSEQGTVRRRVSGEWFERKPTTPVIDTDPLARCPQHGRLAPVASESVAQDIAAGMRRPVDRVVGPL
jgi:hypothetical protein